MANKLLLADDSQTTQKVVELVLEPEDFEILAFNNGEEALQALESVMPDVVLADIGMPKLNGYQLCGKIKSNSSTLHIPVILLAGAFEPFDEDYARSIGADDYILKPFESNELISKVKSLLIQQKQLEMPEEETREKAVAAQAPEIPQAVSIEEISRMVKEAIGEPAVPVKEEKVKARQKAAPPPYISRASGRTVEDIVRDSVQYLSGELKADIEAAVRQQLSDIIPGLVAESLNKAMMEMSGAIQSAISSEIKKVVPDLAESIIKQEIKKITSELA